MQDLNELDGRCGKLLFVTFAVLVTPERVSVSEHHMASRCFANSHCVWRHTNIQHTLLSHAALTCCASSGDSGGVNASGSMAKRAA